MQSASKFPISLIACLLISNVSAGESEEILKVKKSTFVNLVDLLVQRGVINQQEGNGLVSAAEQEAAEVPSKPATGIERGTPDELAGGKATTGTGTGKIKHVGYVPEFVKKEIREQVRAELKADVLKDVKQDAKDEGWGIPAALPEWVVAINPSFDLRVRFADEFYAKTNEQVLVDMAAGGGPYDWLQINKDGGIGNAYAKNEAFLNNSKDRLRLRERFRLGFEAKITDGLKAGIRFATSNTFNPVSNDQTLGNTGQSYQFAIDRSYLQYDYLDDRKTNWFSLYAGRIINPFVSTDMVYDPDLSFEGVAGSFRFHFNQGNNKFNGYRLPNPTARFGVNQGQQSPDSVFVTLGVFPIQDVNLSVNDKWLYGGQVGADWLVFGDSRLQIATAYYVYDNLNARKNVIGHENDWTAPQFVQKGNSMVAITDFNTGGFGSGVCNDVQGCLFGLASEFKIFNATAMFDYAGFAPTHLLFTADYAKNQGFDRQRILSEFSQDIKPRTVAYQIRIDVGHPEIRHFADWNVNLAYRYVQRDAVLDAFTDSIFHLGGTDAKGWVLGTQYGLAKNTWLNLRWFSTDAIDGPKYSVDTVNVDLNARF
jgi:hypothetical protein